MRALRNLLRFWRESLKTISLDTVFLTVTIPKIPTFAARKIYCLSGIKQHVLLFGSNFEMIRGALELSEKKEFTADRMHAEVYFLGKKQK